MAWAQLAVAAYDAYSKGSTGDKSASPGNAMGGTAKSGADIDFSGFTVATGSAKAYGATIKKNAADDGLAGLTDAAPGALASPIVLLGLGGLALVSVWSIFKPK